MPPHETPDPCPDPPVRLSRSLPEDSYLVETSPRLPPSTGLAATFRSLRHRNYRLYFFGQLISLMGTWMQSTALSWLMFDITGESTWTSSIVTAQILPTFLFGVWGGALAERWPKRSLILLTQSVFLALALLLAAMAFAG